MQSNIRQRVRQGGREALLLLQHPHVLTLGRNASPSDILVSNEWLRSKRIDVVKCDRGGRVTYHGPGQLVGYPIIDLSPDRRDIRRYVRDLIEVLVTTLELFHVSAQPRFAAEELGVWVGSRKIASIGVHISRWITTHGFALNVNTDLDYFSSIVPCGLAGVRMTSLLEETGTRYSLDEVAEVCCARFCEVFLRTADQSAPERMRSTWPIAS